MSGLCWKARWKSSIFNSFSITVHLFNAINSFKLYQPFSITVHFFNAIGIFNTDFLLSTNSPPQRRSSRSGCRSSRLISAASALAQTGAQTGERPQREPVETQASLTTSNRLACVSVMYPVFRVSNTRNTFQRQNRAVNPHL